MCDYCLGLEAESGGQNAHSGGLRYYQIQERFLLQLAAHKHSMEALGFSVEAHSL